MVTVKELELASGAILMMILGSMVFAIGYYVIMRHVPSPIPLFIEAVAWIIVKLFRFYKMRKEVAMLR